jgi:L-asparaginase
VPRVHIIATGGTIASRIDPQTGAATPAVSANELIDSVPELADVAEVGVTELALVSSWNITLPLMAEAARTIRRLAEGDDAPDGFVVTHGTDTMEETAFALEMLLDVDQPVVHTGAMRAAGTPGADGPRNLLAAVRVATSPPTRGIGSVLVMNEEIHAARYVTKTHTTATDTFASPGTGPVGRVDDDTIVLRWRPPSLPRAEFAEREIPDPDPSVQLLRAAAGVDETALRAAREGAAGGVVLEGSGAGNVPEAWQPVIGELVETGRPVVLASRCVAGRVVPAYGGRGGGATLRDLGVIGAQDLSGPKARLALAFLLGAGADADAARDWFAELGA